MPGTYLVDEEGNPINSINPLSTTFNIDHTFHDAATSTGNGTALTVGSLKTLTIEIYGTSASRTITFYGKGTSGTLRALMGVNLSSLTTGINTTGTGEIWQFEVTGLEYVVMDLTAVAGGNVTVKGRAVS